ncbi:MAG: efflux RND transporter periplasmic adaptor subunit [Ignavibacteria bacterium]
MRKTIIIVIVLIGVIGISIGVYMIFSPKNSDQNVLKNELYVCPMHPQIHQDHPGVCPICNMELILKSSNETMEGMASLSDVKKDIGDVILSPSQQVLANVQTEKVTIKEFSSERVFNGYIKIDEKNMRHISTPVSGKIVKMFVNFEGQVVSKGQKVFEMYSPEIFSTEKEYLLALENYENVKNSDYDLVITQAENLLNSTRTRLRLWEVSPQQIEELENTKEVKNYITVYSKYSGIITKKIVHEGHWAVSGEDIYDVADMSTVWVIANIPEADVQNIKISQSAFVTSVSYPGEEFFAKVNFISPLFNPETRTLEVRLDVTNKNFKLKPDMFVKVSIKGGQYQWNIMVPRNAVLRTGKMDMVYIKKENNVFSPKMVNIGGEQDGYYLVTSGLKEGDEIVTSAGFLIDSESQIRSGSNMQNMEGMNMNNKDEEPKFNEDQDVMKDMEKK